MPERKVVEEETKEEKALYRTVPDCDGDDDENGDDNDDDRFQTTYKN